jgi:hydantoinase/carbamoylase family amidase
VNGSAAGPDVDAGRVIADLRELDRLTGGPGGARRVAWGPEWSEARSFLEGLLGEIGLEAESDQAGNLWSYLEGDAEPALALGSHLDSVPQGGWLDGPLGVMAGLGVLRAWVEGGRRPPRTLALVDWADEEGAFGRSLLGSSAASGSLDPDEIASLKDTEGRSAEDVLAGSKVKVGEMGRASSRLDRLAALLELHIEQGPVLESEGIPIAAVSGTVGIERWRFSFAGEPSHAGTTPMDARHDAGRAAAGLMMVVGAIGEIRSGVATTGSVRFDPGTPTVIPGRAEIVVDLRNATAADLAGMLVELREAAQRCAQDNGCEVSDEAIWRIDPTEFDPALVALARQSCEAVAGTDRVLVSGALHDAAEAARRIPVAMLFVRSIGGVSHSPAEDSSEADLELAIRAYAELASRAMAG